jgi:hypothetical protein
MGMEGTGAIRTTVNYMQDTKGDGTKGEIKREREQKSPILISTRHFIRTQPICRPRKHPTLATSIFSFKFSTKASVHKMFARFAFITTRHITDSASYTVRDRHRKLKRPPSGKNGIRADSAQKGNRKQDVTKTQ